MMKEQIWKENVPFNWMTRILSTMPEEFLSKATCQRCEKGARLLRAGDSAECVFFLLSGRVSSINEQINGLQYNFASFQSPAVFGEFEAFSGYAIYRSTLICETECQLLSLPRELYLMWMQEDAAVLFERTCAITADLLAQARREREFLFCSGEERLAVYLAARCRLNPCIEGGYLLLCSLQQMADGIGCSVRTVQRSLACLAEKGLVQRSGHRIFIRQADLVKMSV